jgi:hypothetical protein
MTLLNKITRATLLVLRTQAEHNCVPDFAISHIAKDTELTENDIREIRDIIQAE